MPGIGKVGTIPLSELPKVFDKTQLPGDLPRIMNMNRVVTWIFDDNIRIIRLGDLEYLTRKYNLDPKKVAEYLKAGYVRNPKEIGLSNEQNSGYLISKELDYVSKEFDLNPQEKATIKIGYTDSDRGGIVMRSLDFITGNKIFHKQTKINSRVEEPNNFCKIEEYVQSHVKPQSAADKILDAMAEFVCGFRRGELRKLLKTKN